MMFIAGCAVAIIVIVAVLFYFKRNKVETSNK